MYPKVKVKAQKEEDDQYAYEKNSLESLRAFEWLSLNSFSSSDEPTKSVVRVPYAYAPKTPPPSYLLPKVEETPKQKNDRPKSAPRPRAVLSSPVNDVIWAKMNPKREQSSSAQKEKPGNNRHAQCAVAPKRIAGGESHAPTDRLLLLRNKKVATNDEEPKRDVRARAKAAVQAEPSSRGGYLKKMILPSSLKR